MNNNQFFLRALFTIALSISFVACGDDDDGVTDTGTSDAGDTGTADAADTNPADSGTDATDAGDAGTDAGVDAGPILPTSALLTTSDFSTAEIYAIDLATNAVTGPLAADDQDIIAGALAGDALLLERGLGNVKLQAAGDPLTTRATINLDPAGMMGSYLSNPLTVVQSGDDRAYVALGARSELTIINPVDGSVTGTVDLTSLASDLDEDPNVDVTGAVLHDGRLYVGLGRFFFDAAFAIQFTAGAVIAVVDAETGELIDIDSSTDGVQGIELEGENPWRGMTVVGEQLWVGSAGDSFMLDGGIEAIDLATNQSVGVALTEETLSAELNGFTVTGDDRVLVLAGDNIVAWTPSSGEVSAPIISEVSGMHATGQDIFVWGAGGLRRFTADGEDVTPAEGYAVGDLPVYSAAIF